MIKIKSNIFIPKKINVGFQNRSDTYTQKLAYIIYTDQKGILRKEKSWNSWRDKEIEPQEFDNIPIDGFVLNKKVGDYCSDWNHRQAYVRVYDKRNFEFEITIENLLFILENATSTKGKGLEGQFIYGWDGKDLLLIPCESPDYKEISEFNDIIHEKKTIKAKDLIIGATYKTKQNEEWIYMGKFDYYGYYGENKKTQFWFCDKSYEEYTKFTQIKTLGEKLIQVIDDKCCDNYADLFDELECRTEYSPVDSTKDEYKFYDLDYFKETINADILDGDYWWSKVTVYCDLESSDKTLVTIKREDSSNGKNNLLIASKKSVRQEKYKYNWNSYESVRDVEYNETIIISEDLEEIFNKLKPQYKNIYLQNGKLKGGKENNE